MAKRSADQGDGGEHADASSAKQARVDPHAGGSGAGGDGDAAVFTLVNERPILDKMVLADIGRSQVDHAPHMGHARPCLHWAGSECNPSSCYCCLQLYFDLAFVPDDDHSTGETIYAHKMVMAAQSSQLRKFMNDKTLLRPEGQHEDPLMSVLSMNDETKREALKTILAWIYEVCATSPTPQPSSAFVPPGLLGRLPGGNL